MEEKETRQQICQRIFDLLETMEEALRYIPLQLRELRVEASLVLLTDFAEALRSIEESLGQIRLEADLESAGGLCRALSDAVQAYKDGNIGAVGAVVDGCLFPAFDRWGSEVRQRIKEFTS